MPHQDKKKQGQQNHKRSDFLFLEMAFLYSYRWQDHKIDPQTMEI